DRLDPRCGPPPAPRVHRPHRLRPRGATAVLRGPFGRHADDLRATQKRRARTAARAWAPKPRRRRPELAQGSWRTGSDVARGLHERSRRRRSGRDDDDRISRSDVFPARAAAERPRSAIRTAQSAIQDVAAARRPRQHAQSPDPRQRRRGTRPPGLFLQSARHMMRPGRAIMIVSEAATLAGIEPFASWNTPICWTGFILFADAIVYRARGNSWLRSSPREFAALALVSIPLWVVFEGYNLVIPHWIYAGLPENPALRLFGYAWSFATIWPAIFEGAELASLAWQRAGKAGKAGKAGREMHSPPGLPALPALSIAAGALVLASPFLVSPAIARYMAAPVFLGFIFLLDPLNRRLGEEALTRERTINLLLGGLLCGVLWEFWNYWSRAKWIYTVPIMQQWKVFEMPLPGYLGFPPFAVECFTMYVFVRALYASLTSERQRGRTIAL